MGAPFTARVLRIAERAAALLPQTAAGTLFNITGGKVLITAIYGEVVVVLPATANATKLQFVSTSPGSTTDLCATLDITGKAVGTVFSIVGVLATALKATTNNMVVPADNIPAPGLVLGPGAIKVNCGGSMVTGTVKWTVNYLPIDASGGLVAA